jgi:hypothetical protein
MKPFKNKRGVITMYIVFFIVAVVIILFTAVLAPFGVMFNAKMYQAGEDILMRANESIANISDTTVRNQIMASIGSSFAATENNIEVNNAMFKYSWLFVVVLAAIVIFLYSRSLVEYNRGFI